ncbi:hypothetical protein Pla123a_00200 [Posidoniimonas polymericola]|uniref:Uncharacterized protein n=1 Tax=Posidoniimonas polymericola TaxID=2528002 RepID=A0A5C5ZD08_9BACT|nr:hypothetical protein [Posidoniimonas polymericola]TWT85214.1 hypothetical protein Pla123a_00200 [Posidoniimonas polymericola]
MKRLVLRLLLAGFVCFGLVLFCIGTAVTLALWSPSFYSERASLSADPAAVQAAEQHFEQLRDDYLRWRAASLQPAREKPAKANNDVIAALFAAQPAQPNHSPTHTIRVTEDEINTLLVSDGPHAGQVSAPRIRLVDGRVLVGVALATPFGELVVSAGFAPQPIANGAAAGNPAPNNELRLQIDNARIGRLPLPLSALTSLLPKEKSRLQGNLFLDTTGELPELALRMDKPGQPTPLPHSLEIADGELIVKLTAPQ